MTAISIGAPTVPADHAADRQATPHFTYKPALDGLRAVAVLSVIAYHFGASWMPGGFLGVDTFFVLSGYLITSLLLVEWQGSGTVRFGAFWVRRARRLLPAIFVLLAVVAIWGALVLPSNQLGALRADSLWTFFYAANWHFIWEGQSYFVADPSPLRHAWSLAIEEQFYLVWPLLVFGCLRVARGRHRLLVGISVAGIVASAVAMAAHFEPGTDPSRAYYGTDTRASQLLVGALLAVVLLHRSPVRRGSRALLQGLGIVAAAGMVWAFVGAHDRSSFLYTGGGFVLFALATAIVIAAIVQPTRNPLRSGLAWTPVRWIGQVSYGLYLWHWPIAVYMNEARTGLDGWELAVVRLAMTFAISTVSYYLLELPIRHRRFRRRLAPSLLLAGGAACTVAAILVATAGATARDPLTAKPGTIIDTGPSKSDPPEPLAPQIPQDLSIPTSRILMLGDSVAFTLADAMAAEAARHGVAFRAVTRMGCGLTTGITLMDDGQRVSWSPGCAAGTNRYIETALDETRPDTVVWSSTWELSDYEVNGQRLAFGTKAWDEWMLREMENVRSRVVARGARLVLLTNPPQADNPIAPPNAKQAPRTQHLNRLFFEFARQHPLEVTVVELGQLVCPGGAPCPVNVAGITLRPKDGGHYEAEGAAWVAPRLMELVFESLRSLEARAEAATTTTTAAPTPPSTAPTSGASGSSGAAKR